MRLNRHHAIALLASILTLSCASGDAGRSAPSLSIPGAANSAIDGAEMLEHIKVLASDDFEGRAPGTRGETQTVTYLVDQFRGLGLAPGNPDGTYVQTVPLVGGRSAVEASFSVGDSTMPLKVPQDIVAWARGGDVRLEKSTLVFVGYGVVAPEYDWDDYKGADLRGKTLVFLINDPAIPDPNDPAQLDARMFKGKAMTYYGRWTYKFEIAKKQGAAAAIIVHETVPAAYPYSVVISSWAGENFDLRGMGQDYPGLTAWISVETARALFAAAGYDFQALKQQALGKSFRPLALDARFDASVRATSRAVDSANVVAKIDGSDPVLKNEWVIYTAHWDHFGWNTNLPGGKSDQVFHGAIDNASGVAALLSLAKAFRALPQPPKRSVLFVATTGEEQQLLGAKFYVARPLYPLRRTLANINMDGMNLWARTRDVGIAGFGQSTLDDMLAACAAKHNRVVTPEARPELGAFYRSDHLEFAKAGVPALFMRRGTEFIGQAADYGNRRVDAYIANDYHKVTDTVRSDWDFAGAVEDTQLLFCLGHDLAHTRTWPQWKSGSEFKAVRDRMAGAAGVEPRSESSQGSR